MQPADDERAPERFLRVPREVVSSGMVRSMTPSTLKVYLILCNFAHYKTGTCFPSINKIRELSGVNKNAICSATRRLTELGLILKRRAPRAFKFKNVYTIIRAPEIDPSIVPQRMDKRGSKSRGKGGRWTVVPESVGGLIPESVESIIRPENMDTKEIEIDLGNRDSFKRTPLPISKKTIEEIKKVKGEDWIADRLRTGAYCIEEQAQEEERLRVENPIKTVAIPDKR